MTNNSDNMTTRTITEVSEGFDIARESNAPIIAIKDGIRYKFFPSGKLDTLTLDEQKDSPIKTPLYVRTFKNPEHHKLTAIHCELVLPDSSGVVAFISYGGKSAAENQDIAERLAKAVNCHDELVAALRDLTGACMDKGGFKRDPAYNNAITILAKATA